jgi:hypothetical protein
MARILYVGDYAREIPGLGTFSPGWNRIIDDSEPDKIQKYLSSGHFRSLPEDASIGIYLDDLAKKDLKERREAHIALLEDEIATLEDGIKTRKTLISELKAELEALNYREEVTVDGDNSEAVDSDDRS